MNKLFFVFLNLMCISNVLIPIFLIHTLMFYEKMSKNKIITALLSAFIILPAISFICYKKIFVLNFNQSYLENCMLFILGYSGIIALNYLTFLIIKNKKVKNENTQKSWKIRYYSSAVILLFMIYLSLPTFLVGMYSKSLNIKVVSLAEKLSIFQLQKSAINSYKQNIINLYIYNEI